MYCKWKLIKFALKKLYKKFLKCILTRWNNRTHFVSFFFPQTLNAKNATKKICFLLWGSNLRPTAEGIFTEVAKIEMWYGFAQYWSQVHQCSPVSFSVANVWKKWREPQTLHTILRLFLQYFAKIISAWDRGVIVVHVRTCLSVRKKMEHTLMYNSEAWAYHIILPPFWYAYSWFWRQCKY